MQICYTKAPKSCSSIINGEDKRKEGSGHGTVAVERCGLEMGLEPGWCPGAGVVSGVPEEHSLCRGSWDRNSVRLSAEGNVRVKQGLGRRAESSCGRSGEAQSGPEVTGLKDGDLSFPLGSEENESPGASLVWLSVSRENHTG